MTFEFNPTVGKCDEKINNGIYEIIYHSYNTYDKLQSCICRKVGIETDNLCKENIGTGPPNNNSIQCKVIAIIYPNFMFDVLNRIGL